MNKFLALILSAAVIPTGAVHAGPGGAQEKARRDVRAGNVRSLRDIEGAVLPQMQGAQYIGPEYDPAAFVYRLKFIQDGHVIFVDVDARTGQVIRQSR
ncbi:MAG: PepSY domain-containing protein [Novosphingobium sp.]